jgi:orotate phosphoribosyltransferase
MPSSSRSFIAGTQLLIDPMQSAGYAKLRTPSQMRRSKVLKGQKAKLADLLFDVGAIKFGAFKVKLHETQPDAPLSPIYLNLRTPENPKPGPLTPALLDLAAQLMIESVGTLPARIAGVPNAGDPFTDAFVRVARGRVTVLRMRKEESDGIRRVTGIIDEKPERGTEVMVVDDLVTQAHSKFEAIHALENEGLKVRGLVVLVDRQQGGRQQIEAEGYGFYTVYTLPELLEHYADTGRVERATVDAVLEYTKAASAV